MTSKSSDKENYMVEEWAWNDALRLSALIRSALLPTLLHKRKRHAEHTPYMFRPPIWSLELYVTQQLVSRKQRKCCFPIVFLVLKPSSAGRSASQQFFEPAVPKLSHVLRLLVVRPHPALSILVIKSDQQVDRQWFTSEQLPKRLSLEKCLYYTCNFCHSLENLDYVHWTPRLRGLKEGNGQSLTLFSKNYIILL